MEIKKVNNYFELLFGNVKFNVDTPNLNLEPPIILTDWNKNLNQDKIFNSAGEYNLGDVYFWGFQDEKTISYLLASDEGIVFIAKDKVKDENLKQIRLLKKEIDVFFNLNQNEFDENVFQNLKPRVILTNKDIKKQGFNKEKGKSLKLNLKKVNNLIFVFEE